MILSIAWVFLWSVFGAIMGGAGWHDVERGFLFGLIFAFITLMVFWIVRPDPALAADSISDGVEALIDEILD